MSGYSFGSVRKGPSTSRDELLPGAVVKGPAKFMSAPALGSVVKAYTDENGKPIHLGRMPPPSPLNLHPSNAAKACIVYTQTSPNNLCTSPPLTIPLHVTSANHSFARSWRPRRHEKLWQSCYPLRGKYLVCYSRAARSSGMQRHLRSVAAFAVKSAMQQ